MSIESRRANATHPERIDLFTMTPPQGLQTTGPMSRHFRAKWRRAHRCFGTVEQEIAGREAEHRGTTARDRDHDCFFLRVAAFSCSSALRTSANSSSEALSARGNLRS